MELAVEAADICYIACTSTQSSLSYSEAVPMSRRAPVAANGRYSGSAIDHWNALRGWSRNCGKFEYNVPLSDRHDLSQVSFP
jgi:hypothetical protein